MKFDTENSENHIPKFKDNRCRACTCSANENTMISLLDGHNSELFSMCTSLEIVQSDELPDHICSECYTELENVHKFRQKCLMSDLQFRNQILEQKLLTVKVEPLELMVFKDEDVSNDENYDEVVNKSESEDLPQNCLDNFICDICNASFKRKSGLFSHIAKHARANSNTKPMQSQSQRVRRNLFNCSFQNCNKSYSSSKGLKRHVKKVHPQICSDKVVKSETKCERDKLFCEKCPKWFYIQDKLDGHVRRIHEGLKCFKCEVCGKEFNKLPTFRLHVDKFHSSKEIPIYKCDYDGCDKQYNLKASLTHHVESIHLKKPIIKVHKNLICETCGKSFRSGFALKAHGWTHTKQFPFPCTRCPRSFESNYKLKVHTLKHLNIKNFVCPHCGLRKWTNKDLQIHLTVHSDEKKFKCKECPQAFNTYGSLNHHVRIHHKKVRPHKCSYCNQTFARKGTKKHHEMTHTGEKPYVCHCGHRFIQAVSLRLHLKVHANQSKSTRRKETETTVEHQPVD